MARGRPLFLIELAPARARTRPAGRRRRGTPAPRRRICCAAEAQRDGAERHCRSTASGITAERRGSARRVPLSAGKAPQTALRSSSSRRPRSRESPRTSGPRPSAGSAANSASPSVAWPVLPTSSISSVAGTRSATVPAAAPSAATACSSRTVNRALGGDLHRQRGRERLESCGAVPASALAAVTSRAITEARTTVAVGVARSARPSAKPRSGRPSLRTRSVS